jgi:hypothetical protein
VLAAVLISVSALGTAALAQNSKASVFVGYSYMSTDINRASGQSLNGWEASFEGKVLPFLGIVADVSGHYGTVSFFACPAVVGGFCPPAGIESIHTVLFGPRVSASFRRVRPFAHVLGGLGVTSGPYDALLAFAVGGGADFRINRLAGWRVQADFLHTHFSGNSEGDMRISTGLVFHF